MKKYTSITQSLQLSGLMICILNDYSNLPRYSLTGTDKYKLGNSNTVKIHAVQAYGTGLKALELSSTSNSFF
jgi:hypothetical protein